MARYGTLTDQSLNFDILEDFQNNGWSIEDGKAVHDSCNEGYISNRTFITEAGKDYTITYVVSGYQSGSVNVIVGGTNGTSVTADGTYTETITAADNTGIMFWSDGDLVIETLRISAGIVDGRTLVFNEKFNTFVGWRSYVPSYATKFLDNVILFKDGTMWMQNANAQRNNFFGVQYPSVIEFYVNINPTMVKTFSSIREVGTHAWEVSEIYIEPRAGKASGQRSRIRLNRFNKLQGEFFADFLRNIDDPRFNNPDIALFKGAVLQGEVAKVRLEVNEENEVRLVRVDVLGTDSQYSF